MRLSWWRRCLQQAPAWPPSWPPLAPAARGQRQQRQRESHERNESPTLHDPYLQIQGLSHPRRMTVVGCSMGTATVVGCSASTVGFNQRLSLSMSDQIGSRSR